MATTTAATVTAPLAPDLTARVLPVLLAVAGLVLVANRWGQALLDDGVGLRILAPPLIGQLRWGPPGGLLPVLVPIVVGACLVRRLPRLAEPARWSHLLVLSALAAATWAVALALVDGTSGLTRPMGLPGHYLLDVGQVGSPGDFLRHFTDRIDAYGTHVRSHPPGLVLVLWAMAQVGLGGTGWAAALVIAGGASAVPALLLIVRELAGEDLARRALPFLVLAPAALYVASTGDALFAGVGIWGVAGVVLATGRRGRSADRLALAGGALFGLAFLLSYGSLLLLLLPVTLTVVRRALRPLVMAGLGGSAVLALAAAAGFWWLDGLATARGEYLESVASVRPYGYFLLANLAGLAIVIGPATVAGLGQLLRGPDGRRPLALLVGPALAMVAAANLSGMSKGEVERIWLAFALCLLPAGALAAGEGDPRGVRRWLWVQVAAAIAVPLVVRTHW